MIKLAQPVAMRVTNEQKQYLAGELENLGYIPDALTWDRSHIVTRRVDEGSYTDLSSLMGWDLYTYEVIGYQPDLFLALAAMTEGDEPIVGEWFYHTHPYGTTDFKVGGLYQLSGDFNNKNAFMDESGKPNGFWPENEKHFTKATKEQIINHFSENKTMNKPQRKVIGYKAPYQLFSQSPNPVKEGDILYPCIHCKPGSFYADSAAAKTTSYSRHLPAEIVEQWEAVYEPQEQVFKVGNFEIKVKDGKAFHKSYNITNFVNGLCKHFLLADGFSEYSSFPVGVKEITFSETGCEKGESKLSEWMEVYNALK